MPSQLASSSGAHRNKHAQPTVWPIVVVNHHRHPARRDAFDPAVLDGYPSGGNWGYLQARHRDVGQLDCRTWSAIIRMFQSTLGWHPLVVSSGAVQVILPLPGTTSNTSREAGRKTHLVIGERL